MTRDETIGIRVTADDLNYIKIMCDKYGMNRSKLILQAVRYMDAVDMKSISQHIFAMQSIVNYMNQFGVSQDNMNLLTKELNDLWLCLR